MRNACCVVKFLSVSLLLLVVVFQWGGGPRTVHPARAKACWQRRLGSGIARILGGPSADGNTAIIGGPGDSPSSSSALGAAWIFTRSAGVWTQQGPKLVGSGAIGPSQQGISVAISGDGNTAIVGGGGDNGAIGAAWVFTRSGGAWTQQGPKLVGIGGVGPLVVQGNSVALSADGSTAIVGGYGDSGEIGAVWVFTRSGGVWTQQGPKLVGTGAVGPARQGTSVALSADGNTALVGGEQDRGGLGAAWVFTRSGGVWTQQGPKLVGTGTAGLSQQGWRVSLSADGNTAISGGFDDAYGIGAAWIFSRNAGAWTQQGPKLVASYASNTWQGWSVALSGDGNTAMIGGPGDGSATGAAWIFTRGNSVWTTIRSQTRRHRGMGTSAQGSAVALQTDGDTAIVG